MGFIGLCLQIQHLIPVEAVEFLRVFFKKMMADDLFRRKLVLHVIKTILTPEIRNATVGGYACTGEEDNVFSLINDVLKLLQLLFQ